MGKKSLFPVLVGVVYVNVDVSFWLFCFLFFFSVFFLLCRFLLFFARNLQLSQHTLRILSNDHVIHDLIFFLFSSVDNPWGIVRYGCYMGFTDLHHKVCYRYVNCNI